MAVVESYQVVAVAVFADDLRSVGGPRLHYESFQGDDSVSGSISSGAGEFSVDFYLGRHPGYSRLIGGKLMSSGNPNITSLKHMTCPDGFDVVEVKLRGMPESSVLLFRRKSGFIQNTFLFRFLTA